VARRAIAAAAEAICAAAGDSEAETARWALSCPHIGGYPRNGEISLVRIPRMQAGHSDGRGRECWCGGKIGAKV
jgi:hypothetical protein